MEDTCGRCPKWRRGWCAIRAAMVPPMTPACEFRRRFRRRAVRCGALAEKQETNKQTTGEKEMHTAANEWAARVAARNEVETARAEGRRTMMLTQPTFDWTGGGAAITPMESGKGVE